MMRSTFTRHRCTAGNRARRRLVGVVVGASAVVGLSASPASAHLLTVEPPGTDTPVVDQGVSHPWAQAHCHAAAPATTGEKTGGTVAFTPAEAKDDCGAENPGGNVHPHG